MGLHLARSGRMAGHEPSASITWREYVAALSPAVDSAGGSRGGDAFEASGLLPRAAAPGEPASVSPRASAARALERALWLVRDRARRAVGLEDVLELQCEAARLRLLLMRVYVRLGRADRAGALARETQAVL